MAIFRGTGGSGSSSDSTIVDAVTAQATIATTKAGEASTSATTATTKASEASTSATTATTKASEASTSASTASTKATEANTAKTGAETAQTAAEAARDAALGHSNTANSSAVQTVAGSNTQVVGVYNNIANVNTVAGVNTDVTTVAGISSDVTTVAADASDIGTVSTNIANVNNVGNNIANVNAVHGNASNINTVAADGTDIGTVSSNIANVNTVAGISSNVTTVAGLESKMDTVIADASDIGAVAGNIGDVTTVAGINSDVDTVAGIAAKVTTVADNISDVQNADTNATNAASSASNASASATSASNSATTATTKATEASNSATAASNSATTATAKASQAAGSATTAGTSASTATTKASEASASATTATTKAGEAASSASAASGSATTAVNKASEASASAASASTSATNSSNAASTWNDFYTTYLGAADAPPTADVQGNALQTGAFYYDTGAGSNTVGLYVYNGSSWVYSTNYNNVTAPYTLAQNLNADGNNITAVGSLGIGTSSPSAKLHVKNNDAGFEVDVDNTVTDGVRLLAYDRNTSTDRNMQYRANKHLFNIGSSERMRIDSSGRVGIGTSSPSSPLTVATSTSGWTTHLYNNATSGSKSGLLIDAGSTVSDYAMYVRNAATNSNFFTIRGDGNVGIGTTSPATALDVTGTATMDGLTVSDSQAGGVTAQIQNSNSTQTGGSRLDFLYSGSTVTGRIQNRFNGGDFQTDWYTGNHGLEIFTDLAKTEKRLDIASNGDISFYEDTGTTPKFFWDASGETLGLGTTNPTSKLTLRGTGGNTSGLAFKSSNEELKAYFTNDDADSDFLITYVGSTSPEIKLKHDGNVILCESAGNVGIGTTSPTVKLDVETQATGNVASFTGAHPSRNLLITNYTSGGDGSSYAINANSGYGEIKLQTVSNDRIKVANNGDISFYEDTGTTPKFFWDASAESLGIGTTSPDRALHVSTSDNLPVFVESTDGLSLLGIGDSSGTVAVAANGSSFSVYTGGEVGGNTSFGTERMRIDSSGNLLVGKTSGGALGTAGIELRPNNLYVTSTSSVPIYANRNTDDGDIIQLRKDNSTVGSIGVDNSDNLVIQGDGAHSGLSFGTNEVLPYKNGQYVNDTVSLGSPSYKWKDLYLSGGVHLGGTGTANKLDDYEEGTFTLNTAGDSSGVFQDTPTCLYTKIGNTVNVFITFRVGTNFTSQNVGGLPFTTSHTGMNSLFISGGIAITSNNNTVSVTVGNNGTTIRFHDNQNTSDAHLPNTTDEYYRLNFTYKTA